MRFALRVTFALFGMVVLLAGYAQADRAGRDSFDAGRRHAGEELDCDLPASQQFKNIGSKVDGYGMCVMTSIEMAAIHAGLEKYRGLRDWAANQPGGAYARKVDEQLAAFCKAKGLPAPRYLQYEGADPGPVMLAAAKSGRMACITYGWSPKYQGRGSGYISHMVCLPKHGSGAFSAVLDNNFIGTQEWMPHAELVKRSRMQRNGREGNAWVFVWLEGYPPPPSPRN